MANDRIHGITMPKWGMTMTEGKIAAWNVAEGDTVAAGQEYVDVETDKIANGVEAEFAGTLRRIVVPEGQSASCGSLIAVMADAAVTDTEIDAFLSDFEPADVGGEAATGLTIAVHEAEGLSLNVVTASGGDGTPVVLLHGFGSDAGAWMFNHETLADGRAVHAIDLPSHGASQIAPDLAAFADMADLLAGVVDELAPGGAHLVGHSLGGRIALRIAARHPDRVRSLTLIAPAGFGTGINREFVDGFIAADRRRPMKAALQILVADPDAISADMIERTLSYKRLDGVTDALHAIAEANLTGTGGAADETQDDLAAVTCPLLILWGRDDAVLSPDGAGLAPATAQIEILDAAGHMPQMERSNRVNELIAGHIASTPAGTTR